MLLLQILEDITEPEKRKVDIRRLIQKLHRRSAEQEHGRAARLIVEKLRHHPRSPLAQVHRLGTVELRSLLARCFAKTPAKADLTSATPTPPETLALFQQTLDGALVQYAASLGTMQHPVLPPPAYHMDSLSCVIYDSLFCGLENDSKRWVLARILLGLQDQWWWLCGSLLRHRCRPTKWWLDSRLTPWQRDDIVAGIHRQYEERFRFRNLAIGQNPWSREACLMVLTARCRDALVDMACARCAE